MYVWVPTPSKHRQDSCSWWHLSQSVGHDRNLQLVYKQRGLVRVVHTWKWSWLSWHSHSLLLWSPVWGCVHWYDALIPAPLMGWFHCRSVWLVCGICGVGTMFRLGCLQPDNTFQIARKQYSKWYKQWGAGINKGCLCVMCICVEWWTARYCFYI